MTVEWSAWCVVCDWRMVGDDADRAAEKHTKTVKHPTVQSGRPAGVSRRVNGKHGAALPDAP